MNRKRTAWFGQLPLAHRILAVNLLTIVLLACGVLYLDAFRNQLSEERVESDSAGSQNERRRPREDPNAVPSCNP